MRYEVLANYGILNSVSETLDSNRSNLKSMAQVHDPPKLENNFLIDKTRNLKSVGNNLIQTSSKVAGVYFGGIVQTRREFGSLPLGGKIFTYFPVL